MKDYSALLDSTAASTGGSGKLVGVFRSCFFGGVGGTGREDSLR